MIACIYFGTIQKTYFNIKVTFIDGIFGIDTDTSRIYLKVMIFYLYYTYAIYPDSVVKIVYLCISILVILS